MANNEKKGWTKKKKLLFAAAAVLLTVILLVLLWALARESKPEVITGNPQTPVEHPIEINPQKQNMGKPKSPEEAKTMEIPGFTDRGFLTPVDLDNGLSIVRSGSYVGEFVEDGSNRICTDVLALVVTNNSGSFLEVAQLAVPAGDRTAYFNITALPAGQSVLVMEKSALVYDGAITYGEPVQMLCTMPDKEFSLHTDIFSITAADHVVNLTNLTPVEISGNLAIYYKNASNGIYIGGITYSKTLQTGVAANGIAQFICENYTVAGSEIVFIVYEE